MESALVVKELRQPAEALVIFLHGLGDSGHGWSGTFKQVLQPSLPSVRFLFPNAPSMPVSLNHGMSMPAWYDIHHLGDRSSNDHGTEDSEGMLRSARKLLELAKKEAGGKRVFIGGFSQGAVVSLTAAALHQQLGGLELAGVVALSGYAPRCLLDMQLAPSNVPVFMAHGLIDPLIAPQWARSTAQRLRPKFPALQFNEYPAMGHSSCAQELADVARFLQSNLK